MAVVVLGVGFTACNNDIDGSQDGPKGNTHVSVTLKLSSSALRAAGTGLPDEYNPIGTWAGKDKFNKIRIYLVDGSSVTSSEFTVGTEYTEVYDPTAKQTYLKPEAAAAMKTTAGQKTVYVVVNETPAVRAWLNKTPVHEFEEAYKNIPLVLANSGTGSSVETSASRLVIPGSTTTGEQIVMTTITPQVLNVAAGVSATQTIDEATKLNRASVQVERAVARVMVTIKEVPTGGYKIPDPNTNGATNLGTVSDITWVVAQGENSLYVQHKKDNPWEWATPNWNWKPSKADFYGQGQTNQRYDYSGLFESRPQPTDTHFGGTIVPTYKDYDTNKGVDPIELDTRWLDGKFVLPTTHNYAPAPAAGSAAAYTGDYVKGNTAYVLIRAKFTPEDAAFADNPAGKAADGTFFVGKDGKFYTSEANAKTAGNTEIAKYEKGKVLYYAWLNPDQVPNWYNSPVLRNNIYHIHVTGFRNLGTNWNPLYPEDPDDSGYDPTNPNNPDPRPEPTDPGVTEPENPIDPEDPLTTSETWMSVDVTVLPWKVHSYEVPLGI